MFKKKWLGGYIVNTNEDYSVRFLNRATIEYKDRFGTAMVSGEMLAPRRTWVLFPEQEMRMGSWQGPVINDPIRKQLILQRVVAAANFANLKIEMAP